MSLFILFSICAIYLTLSVATRVLFKGIHSGVYMGISATGKKIYFEALENFKVVGGKIVESWGYWPDKEIEEKLR